MSRVTAVSPVVLLASGTRGDVQPFLALAVGLQEAGIPATIAAAPRFRSFVENRGVGFAPLEGNPSDLMDSGSGSMAASVSGGIAKGIVSTVRFLRVAQDEYRLMLESAAAACRPSRAILAGLSSTWGLSIAEALRVPFISCMLQPFGRTHEFPSALVPIRVSLGRHYNSLTYRVLEQAMWQPWRRTTNSWRRHQLRLRPFPFAGPWRGLYASGVPCLYGYSPVLAPPPGDWPSNHIVTGSWYLDGEPGWGPPPVLERFLSSGDPVIFIGFGSMGMGGRFRRLIERAIGLTGLRAVVSTGGSDAHLDLLDNGQRTMVHGDVPHWWLFPRVCAVVHHGGAGTTAEGVRAGVPSIIIPVAADQYFWAERVAALGAGLRPPSRRSLSPAVVAELFRRVTRDPDMREKARRLGAKLREERGVSRAVEGLIPILGSTVRP